MNMNADASLQARISSVTTLAGLALFQLSTAGMELFHTNMLYWLASERPNESAPVSRHLGLPGDQADQRTPFIRREWHHIDLVVCHGDDQTALVVENKIGAIPTAVQLARYYVSLESTQLPFSLTATKFVLLTLTPPSFALPPPWRSVTYRDLLPALRETVQRLAGADTYLVAAYADMVARLDEVAAAYDPGSDLDAPFALSSKEWRLLNESRVLSLVEKVRAGRFAELATRVLSTEIGKIVQVESGFSNGSGILQWFVPVPAGRRFGWQIQGGMFRLVAIGSEGDPRVGAGLEALVSEMYESYFDFTLPDHLGHALSPYKGKKQWLGYKPSFVYRYAELTPQTTWNDLLGLVELFSRRAIEFVEGRPDAGVGL